MAPWAGGEDRLIDITCSLTPDKPNLPAVGARRLLQAEGGPQALPYRGRGHKRREGVGDRGQGLGELAALPGAAGAGGEVLLDRLAIGGRQDPQDELRELPDDVWGHPHLPR